MNRHIFVSPPASPPARVAPERIGSERVISERVTVTMPAALVAGIDRYERNRSRFIAEAVRQELKRRRRQELLQSLEAPHPDSQATAALGLEAWGEQLPAGDSDLLDSTAGVPLRWIPGKGWQEPAA